MGLVENLLGGIKCFMTFMIINIDEYNLLMGLGLSHENQGYSGC